MPVRLCLDCRAPIPARSRCRPCERKYRGSDWPSKRRQARERDGHRCTRCAEPCPHFVDAELLEQGIAVEREARCHSVDHIVPVRDGGSNELENLRTLCHDCHVAIGA